MFYTELISSHNFSNDSNNKKFITIAICSNYVFLLILVIGDPHGATAKSSAGNPHGIQRVN